MTSRLKLKKKKYHQPLQEPPSLQNVECNKTTEDLHKKSTSNSSKMKTNEECSSNKIKTTEILPQSSEYLTNIKTAEVQKKTYKQSYAKIASSSMQINDESEIFRKAIESAKKHKIKMKAGRKDIGYGNCALEVAITSMTRENF